jgi:hypothetical protein
MLPNALVQLQAQYNHRGVAASEKFACLLQRLLGARAPGAGLARLSLVARPRRLDLRRSVQLLAQIPQVLDRRARLEECRRRVRRLDWALVVPETFQTSTRCESPGADRTGSEQNRNSDDEQDAKHLGCVLVRLIYDTTAHRAEYSPVQAQVGSSPPSDLAGLVHLEPLSGAATRSPMRPRRETQRQSTQPESS